MKPAYLAVLLALAGCDGREQIGRYQATVAHGSSIAEDRVWVLDTVTGRISLCYESAARIGCIDGEQIPTKVK